MTKEWIILIVIWVAVALIGDDVIRKVTDETSNKKQSPGKKGRSA